MSSKRRLLALVIVMCFFLLCGFLTTLNDTLIPYLQDLMELNYTSIMLIQLCFYMGYFICSPLAGKVIELLGYKRSILLGLLLPTLACLCIYPAAAFNFFPLFLLATFLAGSGISILQVAGNPYAMSLGDPKTAASRLTLVQAFTSIGTTSAPFIGSLCISIGKSGSSASAIQGTYLFTALVWGSLITCLLFFSLPSSESLKKTKELSVPILRNKTFLFCFFTLFAYIGAEVCIGSFLVRYIEMNDGTTPLEIAARWSSIYWGGFLIGRFAGAWILKQISETAVLVVHTAVCFGCIAIAMSVQGQLAFFCILLTGLCNSIMFPVIFSISLHQLKDHQRNQAAGILCMANLGGALFPVIQGVVADTITLQASFIVPLFAMAFIFYFALKMHRVAQKVAVN